MKLATNNKLLETQDARSAASEQVIPCSESVTDCTAKCRGVNWAYSSDRKDIGSPYTGEMSDEEDEPLDPRIQTELETLNKASLLINRLENEIDDARARFRSLLTDSTQQLDALSRKLGSSIEKAKPYYDCRLRAKEVQAQTYEAAMKYERAMSQQAAAREMVELAEQGFQTKQEEDKSSFNTAWQEMLNHATIKVMEAENERVISEGEHQRITALYSQVQEDVTREMKENKRSISKSKAYYERKATFHSSLEKQKEVIDKLQTDVDLAKKLYANTLSNLENISMEIHNNRQQRSKQKNLGKRESGVGSETPPAPPGDYKYKPKPTNNNIEEEIIISYPPAEGVCSSRPSSAKSRTHTPTPQSSERISSPTPPPHTDTNTEGKGGITKQGTFDSIDISGIHIDITSADLDIPNESKSPVQNGHNNPSSAVGASSSPSSAACSPSSKSPLSPKSSLPVDMTCVSASSSRTASPVIMRHKRMLSGSLQLSAKRLLHETSSIDSDSGSVSSFVIIDDECVKNSMSNDMFDGTYEAELRKSIHEDYSRLPASLAVYQKSYETTRKSVSEFPPHEAELKLDQVLRLLEDSDQSESVV